MRNINKRVKHIKKVLDEKNLAKVGYNHFKTITPVDTGNAKRNTSLDNTTIKADYPYAKVLDKGRHMTSRGMRGSQQAPEGMTKPTFEFIVKYIKQALGK